MDLSMPNISLRRIVAPSWETATIGPRRISCKWWSHGTRQRLIKLFTESLSEADVSHTRAPSDREHPIDRSKPSGFRACATMNTARHGARQEQHVEFLDTAGLGHDICDPHAGADNMVAVLDAEVAVGVSQPEKCCAPRQCDEFLKSSSIGSPWRAHGAVLITRPSSKARSMYAGKEGSCTCWVPLSIPAQAILAQAISARNPLKG